MSYKEFLCIFIFCIYLDTIYIDTTSELSVYLYKRFNMAHLSLIRCENIH